MLLVTVCACSASATLNATYVLGRYLHRGSISTRLDALPFFSFQLRALGESQGGADVYRIGFLGDSTVMGHPFPRKVSDRLRQLLRLRDASAPSFSVVALARPGLAAFEYYFLADRIVDTHPDLIILPVNLSSTSRHWRATQSAPEFAAWLAPSRIGEALMLPLTWIGLTVDNLLYYVAIERLGGYELWNYHRTEQAVVGRIREHLDAIAAENWGFGAAQEFSQARLRQSVFQNTEGGRRVRLTREGVMLHFGAALEGVRQDHPVLRAYNAAISAFVDAEIPVLVYVVPANIEHFRDVGLYDEADMQLTIDSISAVVRGAGASFLDLHDLFGNDVYRDASGHFKTDATVDGPLELARELLPHVLAEAQASRLAVK